MSNDRHRQKARQPTNGIQRFGMLVSGRKALKALNTGYDESGANLSKGSMKSWVPEGSSPQSDIDANLSILRPRSRSAYMNIPIATSAINTSGINTIGSGLQLRAKIDRDILGMTLEEAITWQKSTQREFNLWASSKSCDLYRRNNWFDMQFIAYIGYLINGDAWAALKYRAPLPDMPYRLRIQLFEADRVSNPETTSIGITTNWSVQSINQNNGNRIINGVEVNDDGAVVAYWISNRYQYDPTNISEVPTWTRVEAFGKRTGQPNILQICHDERATQYRGVPYLAPALESLKQVGRYTDAELVAAIIRAYFTLFFEKQSGVKEGFGLNEAIPTDEKISIDPNDFELGPGSMNELPPGYSVKTVDGGRTLSAYESFSNQIIRQISACLDQPYEVLLKSFNSSFTASRAALLQAWAAFRVRRTWFSRDFCQPGYEAWLSEAVAIGRVPAPGFFDDPVIKKAWCGAEWYGPVMGVLDPVKEAEGAAKRIANGLSTGERESAEMTGTDFDENIIQRGMELRRMQEAGLAVPQMTGNTTTTKGGNE